MNIEEKNLYVMGNPLATYSCIIRGQSEAAPTKSYSKKEPLVFLLNKERVPVHQPKFRS